MKKLSVACSVMSFIAVALIVITHDWGFYNLDITFWGMISKWMLIISFLFLLLALLMYSTLETLFKESEGLPLIVFVISIEFIIPFFILFAVPLYCFTLIPKIDNWLPEYISLIIFIYTLMYMGSLKLMKWYDPHFMKR